MGVMRNSRASEGLRETLLRVYDPTTRTPVPWLLTGRAAMALQGANVDPAGLEFRAMSQYAVMYFAQLMRPFEAGPNTANIVYPPGGNCAPSDTWRSNVHQRLVAWSAGGKATWLGRWHVEGVEVQVTYIRNVKHDPVSQAVRSSGERVPFEGKEVAVVPLEYLLAESGLKNDVQLTHRLLHAIRAQGCNPAVLQTALGCIPHEKASRLSRLLEINLVAG